MRRMGIDEAGRGCVLGALVVGAFVTDLPDEALREAGAADSKALSPARRERALDRLRALGDVDVREIDVASIDGGNLNALEEASIVDLIRAHRPDVVHIDALGHPRALRGVTARIEAAARAAGLCPQIVMEPKADATWPTVGAASIAAKVHRDAALRALDARWGALGSGYPSDPTTRGWLASWQATGQPWPPFVRTRWATLTRIAEAG